MTTTITTIDARSVRQTLKQLTEGLAFRSLAAAAEETQEFIEAEAAKHNRSGALVRSVFLRRTGDLSFEVGHDLQVAPHALFVHWGTNPHVIRPKNKKMLRWPAGGKFIFARKVHHPGYKGDPWMVRAAARVPAIFERHVAARLAHIKSGA